jgi:predicted NAD/FAD-binding protein
MQVTKPKIAIIGTGISGLSSAWFLRNQADITLFEKENRIGGHTNTVVLKKGANAGTPIDTGFIVMNDRTYPLLHRFFQELGVRVRAADMSFGYLDELTGLAYSGRNLGGLVANPSNLLKADFYKMVSDFLRFNKLCREILDKGQAPAQPTLGEFLKVHNFSDAFRIHYLVPMGAAIWSTSNEDMLEFPTSVFLHFFKNHGLLQVTDRPQWQTVVGGSHSYLKAFQKQFAGTIRTGADIWGIRRSEENVVIRFRDGSEEVFDRVIFAVHADQVLPLLDDPSTEERELFSVWKFQKNLAVLHTDSKILPKQELAQASWNFIREDAPKRQHPVAVSYDMNRLQGFHLSERYLVSLNLAKPVDEDKIIEKIAYEHPTFNPATLESRAKIRAISGERRTSFVGAWFHNGFHEDGIRSAVEMVQNDFGIQW